MKQFTIIESGLLKVLTFLALSLASFSAFAMKRGNGSSIFSLNNMLMDRVCGDESIKLESIEEYIYNNNININTRDGYGYTPLDILALFGDRENNKSDTVYPLEFLALGGNVKANKFDTNKFNTIKKLIPILLKHGAKLDAKDEYGKTAYDTAQHESKLGHASPEFVKLFNPANQELVLLQINMERNHKKQ